MKTISELMTLSPYSLSEFANVHKARKLLAEHRIRHLPIVSADNGAVVGIVTQRQVLRNAIAIINQRGFEELAHVEKSMSVTDIMDRSPNLASPDSSLLEVARALKKDKNGCVLVVDGNKLMGIITSSDFVDLAIENLSENS